jgi:periplasmic protein TonB
MTATGFFEQKSVRPGGFALVVGMHAAVFAGLVLIRTTIAHPDRPITEIFNVVPPRPTEEPPPEPRDQAPQPTVLDVPPPIVRTESQQGPIVVERDPPILPPVSGSGTQIALNDVPDLPPPPVRVEAQFDPRFAADVQPPYPPAEESAQRGGRVRIRLTIGADGRVKAIDRLTATSDAFWRATERHARARWRFRPATLDGRPVESIKTMTITFQIEA